MLMDIDRACWKYLHTILRYIKVIYNPSVGWTVCWTHLSNLHDELIDITFCLPVVCLDRTGFVEPTLCATATEQSYVVHHRPALCTMVQKGDLMVHNTGRWCTHTSRLTTWYYAPSRWELITNMQNCFVHQSAQCRLMVHNAGRWCTI